MEEELEITAREYSTVATMLIVGYIVFQIPGTMLIKKFGPSYQFGFAMVAWGLFTTCLVTTKTVGTLMGLRFLIGSAEAFVHGTLIYLSFWYRYSELATRGALFEGCAALGGAFNGIIGHHIQLNLDGVNNWRAWRWIFLIEGVVPLAWGFVVVAFLPSSPETVRGVFSEAEKDVLIRRSRTAHNTESSKIRMKAVWQVLLHPAFWALTLISCCIQLTTSSLSNFLQPIIAGLGWKG